MSGKCPVCHYRWPIRAPRGGDGSVLIFASHRLYQGAKSSRCDGSGVEVSDADQIRKHRRQAEEAFR